MQITLHIHSNMAEMAMNPPEGTLVIGCTHFETTTWDGCIYVPDEASHSADAVNEYIFRLFNRVTDEDAELLESIGYHLPSLSVGDEIQWFAEGLPAIAYKVAWHGFQPFLMEASDESSR